MLKVYICPQIALKSESLCGPFSPHQGRRTQILIPAPLLTSLETWSKFLPSSEVGLGESKAAGVLSQ